jgi:dihydropyrimidinase
MISSNAARIMGLYPRKGALAAGREGHVVTAWPATTILRGNVVVKEGAFQGDLRHGQFFKRKVADEIRSRPAV